MLPELEKPPALAARGGAWFACGAQQLHVGVAQDFTPAARAHPALAVDSARDLDALAERLTSSGSPVHWDDELPGVARFYTEDPWGNRLELLVGLGGECGERVAGQLGLRDEPAGADAVQRTGSRRRRG